VPAVCPPFNVWDEAIGPFVHVSFLPSALPLGHGIFICWGTVLVFSLLVNPFPLFSHKVYRGNAGYDSDCISGHRAVGGDYPKAHASGFLRAPSILMRSCPVPKTMSRTTLPSGRRC